MPRAARAVVEDFLASLTTEPEPWASTWTAEAPAWEDQDQDPGVGALLCSPELALVGVEVAR
jgi:hypothetical protein